MTAQQLLDQVQSLVHLTALETAPQVYAHRLAAELHEAVSRDQLAARDERLREALARIDSLTERAMRIRLEHVLADEIAIGAPTRKVFASTVLSYADKLDVLAGRASELARRGGSRDPSHVGASVVESARAVLALRAALVAGVLSTSAELAKVSAVLADRNARDRRSEESTRRAWSSLRRELEAVAANPERIADAALPARLATWPDQLDDPDPASEPTFADMIEID